MTRWYKEKIKKKITYFPFSLNILNMPIVIKDISQPLGYQKVKSLVSQFYFYFIFNPFNCRKRYIYICNLSSFVPFFSSKQINNPPIYRLIRTYILLTLLDFRFLRSTFTSLPRRERENPMGISRITAVRSQRSVTVLLQNFSTSDILYTCNVSVYVYILCSTLVDVPLL